ncbi:hypothetical protein AADZ91_12545 [Colwelliaceae bacterium 6441]
MSRNNLTKYLQKYAEPEVDSLLTFPRQLCYSHVLIIPAYKETSNFVDTFLQSQLIFQNVLLIIVINQPDYDDNLEPQQHLYRDSLSKGQLAWQNNNLSLVSLKLGDSSLLIVDRFSTPIPEKLGVGLARKIGADLACYLHQQNIIKTAWLHSSDADAKLPDNYFTSLIERQTKNSVAACYNFIHQSDNKSIALANLTYERSLRYYVAGLTYAGSPYNFFTIGSVLAFKIEAYASVRGFPKRSAGEDFYLLNKLAKLGKVLWLSTCVIQLAARMSNRVPFGTGPAVKQIIDLTEQGQVYCYYHPVVFEHLKVLLKSFSCLYERRRALNTWYELFSAEIKDALVSIGFEAFIEKQQKSNQQQFDKQLTVWFDAFKTLKFIHHLRDHHYENLPLTDAIEQASFCFEQN